ncbi:transposase [Synechococcus sp. CBW1004]|uniref:transposase n=1 Tax=Synechococcus sp. CBW1004 TaxID=1353136 RepID=UPI0018CD2EC3|nr:transposase [Synechococcus sp. CBW1004]QPN64319.1 transposase [Synechococcus sp. CBW1004]
MQCYNCQAAVDAYHQIIVAVGVSSQAADQQHVVPILERIVDNTGYLPLKLIADAGYCSTGIIGVCEQRGLDALLSINCQDHGKRPRPSRGPAPEDLNARGRMDRKLPSKAGQAIYELRKLIVEPVFGLIKGTWWLDFFLLRGLEKVNGDWALIAITHNT